MLNLRQIGVAVDGLRGCLASEQSRHEQAIALIQRDLRQVQTYCPHPRVQVRVDPAGNEVTEECELCGKQRRKPLTSEA